mgnify:CR=1 FL=1
METDKAKLSSVKISGMWTPPTTLGPPLPLPVSDQLLEELAGELQKWTPPTTLTPPTVVE